MTKLNLTFKTTSQNEADNVFSFVGYGAAFDNIDHVDDVITYGAFSKSIQKRPEVKMLWQHSPDVPVGRFKNMREDNYGLYVEGEIYKDIPKSAEVIPLIKNNLVDLSIGYVPLDFEYDKRNKTRILKQIDLHEISIVTFPANDKAKILAYKKVDPLLRFNLADREYEWDSNSAVEKIREFTNSKDAPSEDYKKYFMYYDENAENTFGAYKLPFIDIIEGVPYIVPRAIFAIAGVLEGSRSGVDLPQADRKKIITIVEGLYKKMATSFNDDSIVSPIKSVDLLTNITEVENYLTSSGLSQKDAKIVISKITEFKRDVKTVGQAQRDVGQELIIELTKLLNLKKR